MAVDMFAADDLDLVDPDPTGPVLVGSLSLVRPAVPRTLESLEQLATVEPSLVSESADVVRQALTLQVVDVETCVLGEQLYDSLRAFDKAADDYFDPDCDLAHKLWKRLTDKRGLVKKPIAAAKNAIGPQVANFKDALERAELAKQRQNDQAARDEQNAAATRAAKQEIARGNPEAAAEILAEAKTAPPPMVPAAPSSVPSTGLTLTKKPWTAEIDKWETLRAGIGEGKYPEFDAAIQAAILPLLKAQAKTLHGKLGERYPGSRGFQKPSLAGR